MLSGLSLLDDPSSVTTGMILQRVLDQPQWMDLELFNSEDGDSENEDRRTETP